MENFNLQTLAAELEQIKATATDPAAEIARHLQATAAAHGAETVIAALEAAVPTGASLGEMIVYRSEAITMLYARVPPRFQSAIHDHTVFACIAQLSGVETSVVYEATDAGLKVAETQTSRPGEVTILPPDAIHHIENPTDGVSSALHVYGGDFEAVKDKRSLWSHGEHERQEFSMERLLAQSVDAMKKTGNDRGLTSLVEAMPAIRPLVEAQ